MPITCIALAQTYNIASVPTLADADDFVKELVASGVLKRQEAGVD